MFFNSKQKQLSPSNEELLAEIKSLQDAEAKLLVQFSDLQSQGHLDFRSLPLLQYADSREGLLEYKQDLEKRIRSLKEGIEAYPALLKRIYDEKLPFYEADIGRWKNSFENNPGRFLVNFENNASRFSNHYQDFFRAARALQKEITPFPYSYRWVEDEILKPEMKIPIIREYVSQRLYSLGIKAVEEDLLMGYVSQTLLVKLSEEFQYKGQWMPGTSGNIRTNKLIFNSCFGVDLQRHLFKIPLILCAGIDFLDALDVSSCSPTVMETGLVLYGTGEYETLLAAFTAAHNLEE